MLHKIILKQKQFDAKFKMQNLKFQTKSLKKIYAISNHIYVVIA